VSSKVTEIRSLPLFSSIADASFRTLIRGAYVQNFPIHAELISEGDSADFLHIIISGSVELFSVWQGRETTMSFLGADSTFILAATIKDRPYLMSARTIEKTRIIMIPSEDIRHVFDTDAEFAKSIVTELAGCYRGVIKASKNIKLRSSSERIANYLLSSYHSLGEPNQFVFDCEKRRIAALLGMTPENLSRGFTTLKKHGVSVKAQTVYVTDAQKLAAFAKPNDLIDG